MGAQQRVGDIKDHQGFKYWQVETTALGQSWWRIEFPGGHKTPPLPFTSEELVKAEIDKIIERHAEGGAA